MFSFKEKAEIYGLNKLLSYLDSDVEKNVPRAVRWLERFDKEGQFTATYRNIREIMKDENNNWHVFIKNIYADLDAETRRMLMKNFIINASLIGTPKQRRLADKEGCNIPWAVLMDPTSACNLNCSGCWAAEYGGGLSMDYQLLDRIINEGKELGVYIFIYSGGEPLVRKKDILALCEKHSDCAFLAFTNGTLIDEDFAAGMKRVHNFVPAISVEGFEEANDSRRGEGTYRRIMRAMDILRENKLPFGISACYTSRNTEEVGSDLFIDAMVEKGAKFCWYFTFMPVGQGSPAELMATDAQREYMYRQVRRFREEKPIFILDFWNDGEYVGGCIAGGRSYLHINANGDVEPCAFIHYSNVNIRDVSLLEALKSPLFMEYRKGQPFNENVLRPCPLLDNKGKLAGMVKRSGAHSTEALCPEDVESLTAKCAEAADRWAATSERILEERTACQNCGACNKPKIAMKG
jgi:MoaA/NifB/PqqE/SkfB family radical SAM enzyme